MQAEGLTLGALKARVRRRIAEELLAAQPRQKVQEIAARLDFSDARAFRRAFHAWTGSTPEAWRRGLDAAPGTATRRR